MMLTGLLAGKPRPFAGIRLSLPNLVRAARETKRALPAVQGNMIVFMVQRNMMQATPHGGWGEPGGKSRGLQSDCQEFDSWRIEEGEAGVEPLEPLLGIQVDGVVATRDDTPRLVGVGDAHEQCGLLIN